MMTIGGDIEPGTLIKMMPISPNPTEFHYVQTFLMGVKLQGLLQILYNLYNFCVGYNRTAVLYPALNPKLGCRIPHPKDKSITYSKFQQNVGGVHF